MFVHDGPLLVTRTSQALAGKLAVKLMQTDAYAKRVQALVVDEAHCILEWYVKSNKEIFLCHFLAQDALTDSKSSSPRHDKCIYLRQSARC